MDRSDLAFHVDDDAYHHLTPVDCINAMFDHTDSEGLLLIPAWPDDSDGFDGETAGRLACRMVWDDEMRRNVTSAYEELYRALKAIAAVSDRLGDTREENEGILSAGLLNVWDVFIRDFETGGVDPETAMDIADRMASADFADDLEDLFRELASENDEEIYRDDEEDAPVTEEEEELYSRFLDAVYEDAESRLTNKIAAYDVIIRARRVCHLMHLNAPDIILNNEAKLLAQAMAVNACAESVELVSDVE